MFGVELYGRVRLAVFRDGLSRREAARRFGFDRGTVAKMLEHAEPPGFAQRSPKLRRALASRSLSKVAGEQGAQDVPRTVVSMSFYKKCTISNDKKRQVMMSETTKTTVQDELAEMIERCGKTHKTIAEEAGFPRPNVISMMKSGEMKVPIDKAPGLATACGGDPVAFTQLVMQEYEPEAWAVLEMTLGEPLTAAERDLLDLYREILPDDDYELNLVEVRQELEAMTRERHGVPGDMVAFAIRAARFFGMRKRSEP